MAEFTYETRRKITEKWVKQAAEKGKHLSGNEKKLLPEVYHYSVPQDVCNWMRQLLEDKKCQNLSEIYKTYMQDLVDVCVPGEYLGEFYYALDQMNQFQMTAGWYRRSVRSDSYEPFVEDGIRLLRAYSKLDFYGGSLADILTGNVAPEIYDHARTENFAYAGILAAEIDKGNEKTIEAVKDILLGEGNTAMISHEMIRGIVMGRDGKLYELLGKFLLAARLQEGARQAVCETMDAGRPEAFLYLFSVIEDNNLVRYSSVKRAVSTWIGIFNENSVDRITDKLVRLMGRCLRDDNFCEEQLAANDSVAISCALWAKGFYSAQDAIHAELELIRHGTKNQRMTASYFNRSLQYEKLKMQAAKEVILEASDDTQLVACFMPSFLPSVSSYFMDCLREEGSNNYYYYGRTEGAKEPKKIPVEKFFDSKEEARQVYFVLKDVFERIPKKGVVLNPCIFPWYQVTMTQSDIASRMCLVAWCLQDEDILDEAAKLVPIVGQGTGYYGLSRSNAARVLLYRPSTETRKNVLFELMHNPEEDACRTARVLVEDMELLPEDYRKIERNLKYKKGREGVLSLLAKQETEELTECIDRLLKTKSEECHMGALDLALQVKKKDASGFEKIRPSLLTLTNPTGKEKVLLDELTGEASEAQDIINTPGYGFYDVNREWVLPPVTVDEKEAEKLFTYGEGACSRVIRKLNDLIEEKRELSYKTAWDEDMVLGTKLERCYYLNSEKVKEPLDLYPFRELWEEFYKKEIKAPELLLEVWLYERCKTSKWFYEKMKPLYRDVFGCGAGKELPFEDFVVGLRYGDQARTVMNTLFDQYVPRELKAKWGLRGIAKLLSVLNQSNDFCTYTQKQWNEDKEFTKRATQLPIFSELCGWLSAADDTEWNSAFALRFQLEEYYKKNKDREKQSYYYYSGERGTYLGLADYVKCYIKGIWDKDLFYKAVFRFLNLGSLLAPISTVEQKGAVTSRNIGNISSFFGNDVIKPVDGKYRFDTIGEEMPAMQFAHELYREIVPAVLKVELKRGEQPTPFSGYIKSIKVIYGIDYMIQILTALGKDTLQRGYSYYTSNESRKTVLSHLLKICMPKPEETAKDLKAALNGTDITTKRLVELAMYAEQWIPMIEEYLKLPGFASGCYYFMAHTSEYFDDHVTSTIAKYTPLSLEELRDGAFDINWFFESYEKLGEKNFKLIYDAAKYSSTGTAHGRARKYADAALGKADKETLKAEIDAKRNKDLLMSIGLLPLPKTGKKKENELLDRYQFIQKYKKESRQFGAQRRASEGRAVDIALRNLSVNAGFTDVTRLTLRMENKLVESASSYFEWKQIDEIEIMISVDENGKSSLQCKKDEKVLKSIPAKYKKNETVLDYQAINKKLKEQYSRTKQMMEQAMEDRTSFEVWEFLELMKNSVVRPIVEPLVVMTEDGSSMGFLKEEGIEDYNGSVTPVKSNDGILIAHPFDLFQEGHWHEYQKLLFEKQKKQPFKQVFRELYVKLDEELEKEESMMFSGNQIQPQKTVGALRGRRWVADYDDGLQKVYYKENIVARIYAMADWFSPSDIEAPTLEWVVFLDRKTGKPMKIKEIPDVIYSEVMRDVDLAVSVAHAGGVDPETSHSTIEMRKAIVECNLSLFKVKNVRLDGNHAIIDGKMGQYTVHLGSGVIHQMGNTMLFVVPVHSQHRGRIFLPFVDDDPKTAEIMSKILLFAEDTKIKDPNILSQIR